MLVHGDYDADGMTGAAVLAGALEELGAMVVPFVPHRTRDGYDLSPAGVERARAAGAGLIVTSDCGISAVDAVREASERGIDVVVTDHHRPGGELPAATAVIDPARRDHAYPFRELSGAGVSFKLVQELYARKGIGDHRLNRYLDLVAFGTIADQVPLLGENRALARFGLRVLQRSRRPGLRALLREAKVGKWSAVRATDVAFRLAPRLNSVGRMGDAGDGLRLLMTPDRVEADALARRVEAINTERRVADRAIHAEAETMLEAAFDPDRDRMVVLWREGWHPGVLGIAASRLVDDLHVPVALVALDGATGRGSARSVPGFHLHEALSSCAELFDRFGGHAMAAGFDIRLESLPALRERLNRVAADRLGSEPQATVRRLDLVMGIEEITPEFIRSYEYLEPFGTGNPVPRILAEGVELRAIAAVGGDEAHLRCRLANGSAELEAIAFGRGGALEEWRAGGRRDVVFELHVEMGARGPRAQAHILAVDP